MATELAIIWAAVSTTAQVDEDRNSIPTQIREGEETARIKGWTLSPNSPLIVPGHSRSYRDLFELAADARESGITAFDDLINILKNNHIYKIKHVIVRDGNRFGRTQALHAYITQWIIDVGADIYSIYDGYLIGKDNYVLWTMNSGYKATSEVKELVKRRQMGLVKRGENGFPVGEPLMIHRLLRDERGKPTRLVIRDEARPLIDAIYNLLTGDYQLILTPEERLSVKNRFKKEYEELTPEQQLTHRKTALSTLFYRLHSQFGIVHPTKKTKLGMTSIPQLLYSPNFWGHTHSFTAQKEGKRSLRHASGRSMRWAYDETEPVPDGLIVHRNTCEPAFTGERSERIKQILAYRESCSTGRPKPVTRAFTGLIICDSCGRLLGFQTKHKGKKAYYVCSTISILGNNRCNNRLYLRQEDAFSFLRYFLVETSKDNNFAKRNSGDLDKSQTIATLTEQVEDLTKKLQLRSKDLFHEPEGALHDALLLEMAQVGHQIDQLKMRIELESKDFTTLTIQNLQNKAIALLNELGVEEVLNLPPPELNAFIKDILGFGKLVWKGRELRLYYPDLSK